jgi:tRNA-specific 2-thiouridylase
MSGGVDSSVAAALLVRQGYQVHGITLQVWEHEDETVSPSKKWQERGCCKVGIAKHVADLLNISHEVIDTREAFRKGVIDDFLQGYTTGTTPNPCVRCNERVKIRSLMELANTRNIQYVATGHYARVHTSN